MRRLRLLVRHDGGRRNILGAGPSPRYLPRRVLPPPPFVAEVYDDATFETATPVVVVDGQDTPGIDAELELGGSVSGNVVAEGGAPLADLYVEACSADLSSCEGAITGLGGEYSITGLRADDYVVEFQPNSGYLGEFYDNALTREQATPVPVVAGLDTAAIDAEPSLDVCVDPTGAFTDSMLVTGFEWIACPSGAANQVLQSSPTPRIEFDADGGLLMTNGRAADAFGPNDATDTSTSFPAPPYRDANDVSLLRLDVDIPDGAQCLSFDFVFGSEEYPEWGVSSTMPSSLNWVSRRGRSMRARSPHHLISRSTGWGTRSLSTVRSSARSSSTPGGTTTARHRSSWPPRRSFRVRRRCS